MPVRTGDKAPPFTLDSKPRTPVDVGALIGKEPVVLLFFPLAFSGVCTNEMCAMRDQWAEWSTLGANVFGISVDSAWVTDRFRADLDIPFPILSDFNKDVSRRYDVLYEEFHGMRGVGKRAVFVIDASGTIAYDWVAEDAGKMPDLAAARAAVEGAVPGQSR